MKIERLSIHNYIATREIELKLQTPITLICGSNEAGKSSICEGIKHAFTGQSTRVSLKKDLKFLVNDDKKDNIGYALIEYDGGKQACVTLPNGAHEIKEQFHSALPYVLDPELFSSLSEDDRRRFVLGLSPESNSTDSVKEKLLKNGCEAVKVDEIIPFLTSGFDAAHKEALNKSREAKSAWRVISGENYGEKKAAEWIAAKTEIDPLLAEESRNLLAELDQEIEEANRTLGSHQAALNGQKAKDSELSRLRDTADKQKRITEKLALDRQQLAMWLVKLDDAKFHAGLKGNGIDCVCPSCEAELTFDGAALSKRGEVYARDEEKAAKVPEYEKTVEMLRNAVANGERDLEASKYAAEKLAELEKNPGESVDEESIKFLTEKLAYLRNAKKTVQADADKQAQAIRLNKEADEKTLKAKQFHKDVQEWDLIASFLAPDGIPSERLNDGLKQINDRLLTSSVMTGWGTVIITNDMTITCNTRPFNLLSVSAKWRVNAMIAEAISHVTGLKLLILDGFDVLSLQGRGQLIKWVHALAVNQEIDTLIMLATLKALPTGLPSSIACHWIENGFIADGPAEKKAA